ncbi:PDDEXK family nuclease [Haladaptatus caseinilyticus]|uniref:endonuclease NucS domain-containing protein n=1 Tax=Haladaptatus caseinilyticus TaxID=2993314 RepID=UPI00224B087B|nr:endonuclease NucS domain-containing protein [Haladaptatus caseinilyticus]
MLRIEGREATELTATELSTEQLSEDDLREWVIDNTAEILGEDFLVIGREVGVADLNDGIDILAIDRAGNLVVIELKRGALRGSVDFQALKYVSYVSRWSYDDIKQQFEMFLQSEWGMDLHGEGATFAETLEEFCDDDYELNATQRIFLVGNRVHERIGSVVLWLREQGIDANIVQFSLFKDGTNSLYLDSKTLVPTSDLAKFETGDTPSDTPWKVDGKRWHLEERTNEDTAVLVQQLVEIMSEVRGLDGPSWTQKLYIAFRMDGTNRVLLRTWAQSVQIDIYDFLFEDEQNLLEAAANLIGDSERVGLDTEIHGNRTRLQIRCVPGDELDHDQWINFVEELVLEG